MKNFYLLITAVCFAMSPVQATLPIVLNSGGPATCGPGGFAGNNLTNPIGNTIHDSYYTSECYYSSETNHVIMDPAIVAGTDYTIYLHFAEIYFGAGNPAPGGGDGSRIFHVDVEGTRILENFDVHAVAGPSNAIVYRYDATATTNGSILITFVPVVQNAKISTIEIRTLGEASDLPPTTSIIDLTSPSFPVEWLDLDSHLRDNQVSLSWSTAWEVNNEKFDIQMSRDAQTMQTIGSVAGSGNSTEPQFYSFNASLTDPGYYLFRLVQQDFDGKRSFSPLIEVQFEQDALVVLPLEPNPATEQVLVKFYSEFSNPASIELHTLDGKVLQTYRINPGNQFEYRQVISTRELPGGLYILSVRTDNAVKNKLLMIGE